MKEVMLMLSYCCSFFEFVFYPHGIRFRGLWSIIMTCHSVSDDELFPSKLGWRCAYDTSIISTLVGIVELGSLKGDPPLSTEVYFYLIDTTFFPISSTSSLGHHHLFLSFCAIHRTEQLHGNWFTHSSVRFKEQFITILTATYSHILP